MKTIKFIIIICLLASCNQAEKSQTPVEVEQVEAEPEFVMTINFKSNKQDEFKFIMSGIEVDELQRKNIQVMEEFSGSNDFESMTGRFGESNISNNINFNLGNKEEKEVQIESATITYGDQSVNFNANQVANNFLPNRFVVYDSIRNVFITKKDNGQHFPSLRLKRKVINQITQ